MILRILLILTVLAAAYTGWCAWGVHASYTALRETPQGQSIGPADAKITIVEFTDYRCHPCRMLDPIVQDLVRRHADVRVVFRHLPVYQLPSVHEAAIALAAGKQGKFLAMHDLLMARDAPVDDTKDLPGMCTQAGVNCPRLQTELHGQDIAQTMLTNLKAAHWLGVTADPTFIIGKTIFTTRNHMPTAADFDREIAKLEKGHK